MSSTVPPPPTADENHRVHKASQLRKTGRVRSGLIRGALFLASARATAGAITDSGLEQKHRHLEGCDVVVVSGCEEFIPDFMTT